MYSHDHLGCNLAEKQGCRGKEVLQTFSCVFVSFVHPVELASEEGVTLSQNFLDCVQRMYQGSGMVETQTSSHTLPDRSTWQSNFLQPHTING